MRLVDRLGFAQRIVVVIALGLAFGVLGEFIVTLGSNGANVGWFGYAPLTRSILTNQDRLSGWERLLVWLGLILVWAGASLWLLRPQPAREGSSTV
jgi:heme/copper-type cytochrome/quinol oxidase subunit 1